jgi:hypothetical protein
MREQDLRTNFEQLLLSQEGKKAGDVKRIVKTAVRNGILDFWGAYHWAFKEKSDSITTTENQEITNLPDDFAGIFSVDEHVTSNGRALVIMAPDEYDLQYPYVEGRAAGTPRYCKIFQDDGVWKIAVFPKPDSAVTLNLRYHTIYQNGEIPDKYIGGVSTFSAKFLWLPGTPEYRAAVIAANSELERLKVVNDPEVGDISRILDSSDVEDARNTTWWQDWVS